MEFHLIGIGGAGMSVVAELLLAEEHSVTGSDREDSANMHFLKTLGARVYVGHSEKHLSPTATVVVSSAIKDGNPELALARKRGQRVWHRSQALAFAAGSRDFIAVAGAHGKTSTTGMLALALEKLGMDPSTAIGASLAGGVPGGHLGTGNLLIAEADESDGSFLNYRPRVAVVTNIEPDHLDHYGSAERFEQAFFDFSRCIVPSGLLICDTDDAGALRLARKAEAAGIRVWTYGYGQQAVPGAEHARIVRCAERASGFGICGSVSFRGKETGLDIRVPGAHMLANAAGAWLVGVELGVAQDDMARALSAFHGAQRRYELRGTVRGIRVIDDYAHHPTEIEATLRTARSQCAGKVRVLFQPHLYSRTAKFRDRFARALQLADEAVITSAYAAREVPADGLDGDAIADLLPGSRFIPDHLAAARQLARDAREGDILFTMGAGDVTDMGPVIVRELEKNR